MEKIKKYLQDNQITQLEFAQQLGFQSQGSVSQWFRRGQVSYDKVLDVEKLTGISRHELRPDLYPPEEVVS